MFAEPNGAGYAFYSSGTYDLQGGVLKTNGTVVSVFGQGAFNHSGGDHNVTGDLVVGSQPALVVQGSDGTAVREGVYNFSDGNLTVSGNVTIGAGNGVDVDPGFPGEPGAQGTFNQSGGTHLVGGDLKIGQSGYVAGGTGLYTLSSGVLTVSGNTFIGGSGLPDGLVDGVGTFTQTGGTHTTLGDMNVGGGLGTYNLSGTGILEHRHHVSEFGQRHVVQPVRWYAQHWLPERLRRRLFSLGRHHQRRRQHGRGRAVQQCKVYADRW